MLSMKKEYGINTNNGGSNLSNKRRKELPSRDQVKRKKQLDKKVYTDTLAYFLIPKDGDPLMKEHTEG